MENEHDTSKNGEGEGTKKMKHWMLLNVTDWHCIDGAKADSEKQ